MTVKTFIVTEVVQYRVEAETPKDACLIIINADEPNDHFQAVTDRYASSLDGTETGSEEDDDDDDDDVEEDDS